MQFLVLALGVFNLLTNFNVLQIQLGELLLLGLNVLVELILFPGGETVFLLSTHMSIAYKSTEILDKR